MKTRSCQVCFHWLKQIIPLIHSRGLYFSFPVYSKTSTSLYSSLPTATYTHRNSSLSDCYFYQSKDTLQRDILEHYGKTKQNLAGFCFVLFFVVVCLFLCLSSGNVYCKGQCFQSVFSHNLILVRYDVLLFIFFNNF